MRISSFRDLTLDAIVRIAYGGEHLELAPELSRELTTHRGEMLASLERGGRVYGVTTGAGSLAGIKVDNGETANHSSNLLLARAVGSAPFLPHAETRALMLCKLISLTSGYAGVSPELCGFLVDRLNDDFTPAVPRTGHGTAGEVIALSHAFQTFIGVGSVLDRRGDLRPAAEALDARGVEPYRPVAKEGIALLAGAPGTIAVTIGRLRDARVLAQQLTTAACLTTTAIQAPHNPYAQAVAELAGDPLLGDVLDRFRILLGAAPENPGESPQAPISFRVAPQQQTHLERVTSRLEADIRRALGAVSDSPAFVDGDFVSTGAFHEIELASGMDAMSLALAQSAELATQRIHRILDPRYSNLPSQLTPEPGPRTGLIVVHKRAVGALNELRRLAMPASLGVAETSLGQEDGMTFAFEAAEKLRRVAHLVRDVMACELVCARQGLSLAGVDPSPEMAQVVEPLLEIMAPVDHDRALGPEIAQVASWLARGGATLTPAGEDAASTLSPPPETA